MIVTQNPLSYRISAEQRLLEAFLESKAGPIAVLLFSIYWERAVLYALYGCYRLTAQSKCRMH